LDGPLDACEPIEGPPQRKRRDEHRRKERLDEDGGAKGGKVELGGRWELRVKEEEEEGGKLFEL